APPAPPPPLVDHVPGDKVAEVLGADAAKLAQIAKLSPKTEKALIANQLYVAKNECPNLKLVDVQAGPGLVVPKPLKVRDKTYAKLVAAGARAKQRDAALEVLSTQVSVKDAVAEWNHAILDAALKLVKRAKPADLKEKSFASDAKKAVGEENSPRTFDETACESGRLGGSVVSVELVTVDASGKPGKVLVKGGADAERFDKDTYPTVYWDKAKGKQYRTLTEIMSVGFFRACPSPSTFMTSTIEDGTWRCKDPDGGDSWDPPNRPIPAWQ
ncbi:MAG TPA: hypothetical protein VHB21_24570, partial [Minicystis sp.]|nr:hypothetical protein [Minicystis sp.]